MASPFKASHLDFNLAATQAIPTIVTSHDAALLANPCRPQQTPLSKSDFCSGHKLVPVFVHWFAHLSSPVTPYM
jgi:hypothetical protein